MTNLGDNDIYRWYMASSGADGGGQQPHDLKLNLIWPCTESHIKKYSEQVVRMVTETPEIYNDYVRPYMSAKREEGRLNWVFNILEGRTEQEDVILRDEGHRGGAGGAGDGNNQEDAFLMLPDLNWDRKTMGSLHLLALVQRRDIWSLRDLKKKHIPWLKYLRQRLLEGTVKMYPELELDQLKLYVHCKKPFMFFRGDWRSLLTRVLRHPQISQHTIIFTSTWSTSCWRLELHRRPGRLLVWKTSSLNSRLLPVMRMRAWRMLA